MAQTDSNPDKHLKTSLRRSAASAPASTKTPAAASREGTTDGPAIGFNELRQACEISALREDLARLSEETESLCGHIEDGVEQVRKQVAGLCAEELADPDVMAPLLQFAVGTLISIRDRARGIDAGVGAAADGARPDWTVAPPSPKSARPAPDPPPSPARTSPSSPAPTLEPPKAMAPPRPPAQVPPAQVPPAPPPQVSRPSIPPPPAPLSPTVSPAGGSWLAPPAAAANRAAPGHAQAPASPPRRAVGPVDWLGPVRK